MSFLIGYSIVITSNDKMNILGWTCSWSDIKKMTRKRKEYILIYNLNETKMLKLLAKWKKEMGTI